VKVKTLTSKQVQAWANFNYALRSFGFSKHCQFGAAGTDIEGDRLVVPCRATMEPAVQASPNFSQDAVFLKSAHPGAYASYRENVTLWAMQITFLLRDGKRMVDVDCDRGRPFWDLVGWAVHACEVLAHKITGGQTDPYPVREAWNKRGMGIPLVKDQQSV